MFEMLRQFGYGLGVGGESCANLVSVMQGQIAKGMSDDCLQIEVGVHEKDNLVDWVTGNDKQDLRAVGWVCKNYFP